MKKILIVEDDRNMHEIYRDIFFEIEKKYNIEFAYCVEEAIQKLEKKEFSLVVLDIIMEPVSGEFLYLKLRQDKEFRDKKIPVIIVSVIKRESLMHLKRINNVSIFEKPIKGNRFLKAIETMVGG